MSQVGVPANTPSIQRIEKAGRCLLKFRWWVLLAGIAATLVLAVGITRLSINSEYRVWFSNDNPELRAFEAVQNVYTRNDSFLFVIAPDSGDVFDPRVLTAVAELTQAAWKLPYSRRVDSIVNFQHTRADGDELVVADLVPQPARLDSETLQNIRRIALTEPALVRRLISSRGDVTGVNVTFAFPGEVGDERLKAAAAARQLRDDLITAYPDLTIRLTGLAMLDVAFMESSQRDSATLTPIMLGLIALLLTTLLRSVLATLAALSIVVLSAVAAMGAAGWAGISITPPVALAPTIIMTLAVADTVHVLTTMLGRMQKGVGRYDAIIESLRANVQPVLLTSITTAVGFLSMNFSDAPPFRDLGNVTAIGALAAFLLSLSVLPALMAILPFKSRTDTTSLALAFDRLAEFVIRRHRTMIWLVGLVIAVLALLATRIELDDDFIRYFDNSIPFRADTDFMTANMTGMDTFEFAISAGTSGDVAEPAYLEALDQFTAWLRAQSEVVHVYTLADTMRRINKSMHGDDPAWYRLPESRALASQYLLLYELSLPFGLTLNDRINLDKSATRIVVTLDRISQKQLRDTAARFDGWIAANLPAHMRATATGPSLMFARISDRNIHSMLTGTAVALLLISGLLVFALRSPALGLVSLVPNLVPAVMAFGIWGLLVRQVDVAVSVVAAMSLGIVVDDTIHFLSKYLRARREDGAGPEDAVRYAFSTVGEALTLTTLVLIAGFCVLALSPFAVNSRMGMLTAITIAFALVVDFLLLPSLLLKLERK